MKEKIMFICQNCGPFIGVWLEKWPVGGNGPIKLGLVRHKGGVAHVVSTIELKPALGTETIDYAFCARCKSLIPKPIPAGDFNNYGTNFEETKNKIEMEEENGQKTKK